MSDSSGSCGDKQAFVVAGKIDSPWCAGVGVGGEGGDEVRGVLSSWCQSDRGHCKALTLNACQPHDLKQTWWL